jgi:hypothetical protein
MAFILPGDVFVSYSSEDKELVEIISKDSERLSFLFHLPECS